MPEFEFDDHPAVERYAENVLIPMASAFHGRPDDFADWCYGQADMWETSGQPDAEKVATFLNRIGDGLATPEGNAKALEKIMAAA